MKDNLTEPQAEDTGTETVEYEEMVRDYRGALRPSELVERKLATLLKTSLPVSQLQKGRPMRRP